VSLRAAPLARRVLSLVYEILLLAAVLMAGALAFLVATRGLESAALRPLLQLWLLALAWVYFCWQWLHGGQTLPMKTWRMRLVTREGAALTTGQAAVRALVATAGTLAGGAGWLWALADPERQFLHDRVAGTRIVMAGDSAAAAGE